MFRSTGDHPAWDFSSNDYTVELFLKPHEFKQMSQLFGQHIAAGSPGNGNPRLVYFMDQHGGLGFYSSADGYGPTTNDPCGGATPCYATGYTIGGSNRVLTLDEWNHVAYVRSGNSFRWYVNGSLVFDDPSHFPTTLTDNSNTNYIGYGRTSQGTAAYLHAKIDNLRVSKGVALYPTEFPNFVDNLQLINW